MTPPAIKPDPTSLWEGYWGIQLLHIGQSLGLFEALVEPRSAEDLAKKLRLESRYTKLWCSAAESCGLLESKESSYQTPLAFQDWMTRSRGFTESHLNLTNRMNETFQAVFAGRALPEPPIALRLILGDSLLQNYRWALEDVPSQLPEFGHALATAQRALEVGCGTGLGLSLLRSHYSQIELYGLESDYECAREAERSTRAVIHVGDLPGDHFGKTFDIVLCFRALSTSKQPDELLSQCSRLLNPDGWLLLGSEIQEQETARKSQARAHAEHFVYQLLSGEASVNFFTRNELLAKLQACGLEIVHEFSAPDWGTPLFLCKQRGESASR